MPQFPPQVKAFERLRAADGLLITADCWQRTQGYHRQRQNFYYQSLFQGGIVHGLGVCVVPAPEDIDARYRNGRWIQVQPGIAIDAQGNPIVVTEPSVFQVQSQCEDESRKTIYIVLAYVDPDELRHPPGQTWVKELYRIVEKTSLDVLDVELCRIELTPGETDLAIAADVFSPSPNTLDLTQRVWAQSQAEGAVTVGWLTSPTAVSSQPQPGLTYLLRSMKGLYPALRGNPYPIAIPVEADADSRLIAGIDLLYSSYDLLTQLARLQQDSLKAFIAAGGVLLVAVDGETLHQDELATVRQELVSALTEAAADPSLSTVKASVQAEIDAIDAERQQYIQGILDTVAQFRQQLGLPSGRGDIAADHPLRTTPFLFSQWALAGVQPVHLFCWGGLIVMVGNLASLWAPDATGTRSRETIRAAHELGINLLHYAWQRRQLIQLQHSDRSDIPSESQASLTRRITP